jgi:hypothetical protein
MRQKFGISGGIVYVGGDSGIVDFQQRCFREVPMNHVASLR